MEQSLKDIALETLLRRTCWFCKSPSTQFIKENMYKVTKVGYVISAIRTNYVKREIEIPICDDCKEEMDAREKIQSNTYLFFTVLGLVTLIVQSLDRTWGYFIMGTIIGIIFLATVGALLVNWVVRIFRTSNIDFRTRDFPVIKYFVKEGWHIGDKPS